MSIDLILETRVPALTEGSGAAPVTGMLGPAGRRLVFEDIWAGLHFVLTNEVPVPRNVLEADGVVWIGEVVDEALMGGAVASGTGWHAWRILDVDRVHAIAHALSGITVAALQDHFDPQWFMENRIHPEAWDQADIDPLLAAFAQLCDFYQHAAVSGQRVALRIV